MRAHSENTWSELSLQMGKHYSLIVMTAQTMSFSFELACKEFSTEKAQHLMTAK